MKQTTTIRLMSGLALASLLTLAQPAYADTEVTGTVLKIMTVSSFSGAPGNGDLRVTLNGVSTVCPGAADPTWGFINANDANFKGIMATVALAYSLGKPIVVGSKLETIPNAGSYCGITYIYLAA